MLKIQIAILVMQVFFGGSHISLSSFVINSYNINDWYLTAARQSNSCMENIKSSVVPAEQNVAPKVHVDQNSSLQAKEKNNGQSTESVKSNKNSAREKVLFNESNAQIPIENQVVIGEHIHSLLWRVWNVLTSLDNIFL